MRKDAEAIFLSAVTGIDYTEEELNKVGDRINNLFRAFCIRNHDRTAQMEWDAVVPNLQKNPTFDADKFHTTVDNFYNKLGWDTETGWPTRATYEDHDLKDVADELEALGKLPA